MWFEPAVSFFFVHAVCDPLQYKYNNNNNNNIDRAVSYHIAYERAYNVALPVGAACRGRNVEHLARVKSTRRCQVLTPRLSAQKCHLLLQRVSPVRGSRVLILPADVLEEVVRQRSEEPVPSTCHVISNRMAFDQVAGAGGEYFLLVSFFICRVLCVYQ